MTVKESTSTAAPAAHISNLIGNWEIICKIIDSSYQHSNQMLPISLIWQLSWASPTYCLIDLTWSWVYFSTAAGVPGTGVGSRWLECLTPNPHAFLFSGSMLPRLHIFMSVLRHSDQVFLGLPLLLALGILILVMEFMHEEERATCPYHLKHIVRRAAVTSCTPNIAQSVSRTLRHHLWLRISSGPLICRSGEAAASLAQ